MFTRCTRLHRPSVAGAMPWSSLCNLYRGQSEVPCPGAESGKLGCLNATPGLVLSAFPPGGKDSPPRVTPPPSTRPLRFWSGPHLPILRPKRGQQESASSSEQRGIPKPPPLSVHSLGSYLLGICQGPGEPAPGQEGCERKQHGPP